MNELQINSLPTELPFYFNSHTEPGNGQMPEVLPFDVYYDSELHMYRMKPTEDLKEKLQHVYEEGSLRDGSISNESGQVYIQRITEYLLKKINSGDASERIVEVGCGAGVILKELRKLLPSQTKLYGIEPGKQIHSIHIEGVELICDFFPSEKLTGDFDLLFSLLVLEHVEDPRAFILNLKSKLKPNAPLVIGVPNCLPFLEEGDISIFIHEHYSYFTPQSLQALALQCSMTLSDIELIEGMIMATFVAQQDNIAVISDSWNHHEFQQKVSVLNRAVKKLFSYYEEGDVAVYVPGRGINTLHEIGIRNCRLIDDNSEMKGKFLPWLTSPIENFQDIVQRPPKVILIYTRTFGKAIKTKCSVMELGGCRILDLNDLLLAYA